MKKLIKKILSSFLQGLLALLPLITTLYIAIIIFQLIRSIVGYSLIFLPQAYTTIPYYGAIVKTITAILSFILITVFGLTIKTFLGKTILKAIDSTASSIPFLKGIYRTIKQITDLFADKEKLSVMKPVLVEYPSPGIWAVAFITGKTDESTSPDKTDLHYFVFIPTTPNPTNGYLAIISQSKIKPLCISTEEAMRWILTGGMVTSQKTDKSSLSSSHNNP